jgi:hypothetical protein
MTSKIWLNNWKISAVVGTIFGVLLPGLPLLAAPISGLVDNSSFAPSKDLLIAQSDTLCVPEDISIAEYVTENYIISICEDEAGSLYYVDYNLGNEMSNRFYDVTTTRDGDYIVTTYDNDGSELVYTVGDYFRLTNNGDQVVYEETY